MATYHTRKLSPRGYPDARQSTGTVFSSGFGSGNSSYTTSTASRLPTQDHIGHGSDVRRTGSTQIGPSSQSGAKTVTTYAAAAPPAAKPRQNSTDATQRRPFSSSANAVVRGDRLDTSTTYRTGPLSLTRDARPAERFLAPHPRGHGRIVSATPAELDHFTKRIALADREQRDKKYYLESNRRREKNYHQPSASTALVRVKKADDDDDYSYTGPNRERFEREYSGGANAPASSRPRRESMTRYERDDRSRTHLDSDKYRAPPPRRDEGPPLSSTRQLERIDREREREKDERRERDEWRAKRRPEYYVDSDRGKENEVPRRRHSVKQPAAVHQERDEGYSSQRDDYERRYRDRNIPRDRVDNERNYSSDREHRLKSDRRERDYDKPRHDSPDHPLAAPAAAVGGLGAAAAAGRFMTERRDKIRVDDDDRPREKYADKEESKEYDSEKEVRRRERKERHRRERAERKAREMEEARLAEDRARDDRSPRAHELDRTDREERDRDVAEVRRPEGVRDERSDVESYDEDGTKRMSSRRRHREKDERPPPRQYDDLDPEELAMLEGPLEESRRTRDRDIAPLDPGPRRRRDASQDDRTKERASDDGQISRTITPTEGDSPKPRRVQVVDPKDQDNSYKPKGILKPARRVPFPEELNPTREGVAPLNAAGKGSIPPGARWTKIKRVIVNPAALEAAHERFEERDDYVIVLRVLSREEIEKFAEITKKIRGKKDPIRHMFHTLTVRTDKREAEWRMEQEQKREQPRLQAGPHTDSSSTSSGYEDERRPKLAIEPPSEPAMDSRMLQQNPVMAADGRLAEPEAPQVMATSV